MTKLLRPFIAGLLVVLPVVLTVALLAWVVNFVYGFVGPGSLFGRGSWRSESDLFHRRLSPI